MFLNYLEKRPIKRLTPHIIAKADTKIAAPLKKGAKSKVPLILPVVASIVIFSAKAEEAPKNKPIIAKNLVLAEFRKFFIEKPFKWIKIYKA